MRIRALPLLSSFLLLSCSGGGDRPPSEPRRDAGQLANDAGQADAGGVEQPPEGLALVERLAGLWSGPATQTPLGTFAVMSLDFRAASDQFLFGRVDLDEFNALRFGFSVETHGGDDVLTYRNGGYFLGLLRDDRTELVEYDAGAMTWRFCHVQRGCGYIDAVYDFEADDRMIFDVMVMGDQHVYWDARRIETRALPDGFAAGLVTQGTGGAPFAPMPDVRATISWTSPLAQRAPVWLVLSTEECSLGGCRISRHIRAMADAGDTSAEVFLQQVHAGDYKMLAVLDRNDNLEQLLSPDSGDGVSLPSATLTVAPTGETTPSVSIVFDLP